MFVPAATVIRQMRLSSTVSVRFVFAEFVYIVRQRAACFHLFGTIASHMLCGTGLSSICV